MSIYKNGNYVLITILLFENRGVPFYCTVFGILNRNFFVR